MNVTVKNAHMKLNVLVEMVSSNQMKNVMT